MLENPGGFGEGGDFCQGRKRRRRVQQRNLPRRDIWDPGKDDPGSGNSRSSKRRRRRHRLGTSLLRYALIAALVAGLPLAGFELYHRIFYQNQDFRLLHLIIETDGFLTREEIADASGVGVGTNLTRLDLGAIRDRLEAQPRVKRCDITRRLPDTLAITVRERVPVAWLSAPDRDIRPLRADGLLIDREGVVFSPPGVLAEFAVLPSIELRGSPRPEAGSVVHDRQLKTALQVIEANGILFSGRALELVEVGAMSEWGLVCRYRGDLEVILDLNRVEEGLRDLDRIVTRARALHFSLATVNLGARKNIPVTFHGEINPGAWRNFSEGSSGPPVSDAKGIREKHLRSIFSGG